MNAELSDEPWSERGFHRLAALTEEIRDLLATAPPALRDRYVLPSSRRASTKHRARLLYEQRRARSDVFGRHARLFGEPAWDMLLDLFCAEDGQHVTATSASIGACVSLTTGLRCIASLEEHGLVTTRQHPTDRRMRLVQLTAYGDELMRRYLSDLW